MANVLVIIFLIRNVSPPSQNLPISAGTNSLLVTTSALGAFSSAQWRHVLRMLTDVTDVDAQALSVASKLCQDLGLLGH